MFSNALSGLVLNNRATITFLGTIYGLEQSNSFSWSLTKDSTFYASPKHKQIFEKKKSLLCQA